MCAKMRAVDDASLCAAMATEFVLSSGLVAISSSSEALSLFRSKHYCPGWTEGFSEKLAKS